MPGFINGEIIDGPGVVVRLTKVDNNIWVLSGANTYSGPITVSEGTLVLAGSPCLSDTAPLMIALNKKVKLDTGVKEKVGSLVINSVTKSTGTWGRVGNTEAEFKDAVFEGDGLLYVGIDPPLPPPDGSVNCLNMSVYPSETSIRSNSLKYSAKILFTVRFGNSRLNRSRKVSVPQ